MNSQSDLTQSNRRKLQPSIRMYKYKLVNNLLKKLLMTKNKFNVNTILRILQGSKRSKKLRKRPRSSITCKLSNQVASTDICVGILDNILEKCCTITSKSEVITIKQEYPEENANEDSSKDEILLMNDVDLDTDLQLMDKGDEKNPAGLVKDEVGDNLKHCQQQQQANSGLNKSLWVTNIPNNMRAAELKQLFSGCGQVVGAKIVTDGSVCYGCILLSNSSDAENCIKKLDKFAIDGVKIGVSVKKPSLLGAKKPELLDKRPATRYRQQKRKHYNQDMDILQEKRRKLDKEVRYLREEQNRLKRAELRNAQVHQKLYEERQKLRAAKEAFEKMKYEHMVAEKERQRLQNITESKNRMELDKLKKELNRVRLQLEDKERLLKASKMPSTTNKFSSKSYLNRRSDDYDNSKIYDKAKLSKSLDYERKKDIKAPFPATTLMMRHSSGGGGVSAKNYQYPTKNNWGEHSWKGSNLAPLPPRINWNENRATTGYSGASGGTFTGVSCPSPPGVGYGNKFDGSGYSHCGRKY